MRKGTAMRFTQSLFNRRLQRPASLSAPCGPIPSHCSGESNHVVRACASAVGLLLVFGPVARSQESVIDTRDPFGILRTITIDEKPLDLSNPFFQSLGTNGRSCASCHVASSAWTITPAELKSRFRSTDG